MIFTGFSPDVSFDMLNLMYFGLPGVYSGEQKPLIFVDSSALGLIAFPKVYDGSVNLPLFFSGGYTGTSFSFALRAFYSKFLNAQIASLSYRLASLSRGDFKVSFSLRFGVYRVAASGDYAVMNSSFEKYSSFSFMLGGGLALRFQKLFLWLSAFPLNNPDAGIVSTDRIPPEFLAYLSYSVRNFVFSSSVKHSYYPEFSLSGGGFFKPVFVKVGLLYGDTAEPFFVFSYRLKEMEAGFSVTIPVISSAFSIPLKARVFFSMPVNL